MIETKSPTQKRRRSARSCPPRQDQPASFSELKMRMGASSIPSRDGLEIRVMETSPRNPTRSPSWRWALARWIAVEGIEPPLWTDDQVSEAAVFVSKLARCRCREDREDLAETMVELSLAHELFTLQPPHLRWKLESRILARQATEEIVGCTGLSAEVQECYKNLYFDISAKIDYVDWILIFAIGGGMATGQGAKDQGEVWRHAAYFGGPAVLDALTHPHRGLRDSACSSLTGTVGDERLYQMAQIKVYEQIQMAPPTSDALRRLQRAQKKLVAMDRRLETEKRARHQQAEPARRAEAALKQWHDQKLTEAAKFQAAREQCSQQAAAPAVEPPSSVGSEPLPDEPPGTETEAARSTELPVVAEGVMT